MMTLKCKKAFLNGKRGFLKPLFVFLAAFQPLLVLAEESKAEMSQIGASLSQPSDYFVQIMLSLILVLLIIFISAWLLRRYGRFPGVADGNLKVLGALSVGQRERILLLQVGSEQILVGVTSSKISTLHELKEPVVVTDPVRGGFSERLQEAMLQRKSQTNHNHSSKSEHVITENS
jgi:flagellar protein FliO/FliZ